MTLSAAEAFHIASQYGVERRDTIIAEMEQANHCHGGLCPLDTWGVVNGRWDARELFKGYMEQIAYEADCDGRAARDFEDRTYGRD